MKIFINNPDTFEALLTHPEKYFKLYSLPDDFLNRDGEISSIFFNVAFEDIDGYMVTINSFFKICPEKCVFPDHILYKLDSVEIRKPLMSNTDILINRLVSPPAESIHKIKF